MPRTTKRMLSALALGLLILSSCSGDTGDNEEVNAQLEAAEARISTLEEENESLSEANEALVEEIDFLSTVIDELNKAEEEPTADNDITVDEIALFRSFILGQSEADREALCVSFGAAPRATYNIFEAGSFSEFSELMEDVCP